MELGSETRKLMKAVKYVIIKHVARMATGA